MKQPLISIIIINWNGSEVLSTCLESLKHQRYKHVETVVWDNNSSDASHAIVKKYPKTRWLPHKKNVGFSLANTLAVKHTKGKYILLLNNDTIVTRDFLSRLVEVLETNPTVGVVQPMLLYKGNPNYKDGSINSIGAYLTPTGFLYYPEYGKMPKKKNSSTMPVYSAYGACMLTRRSVIQKVGLFDTDFFAYFEESDFCHRVWLAGYSVVSDCSSFIYHIGSVSTKKHNFSNILFHSYKNRLCSYIKNFSKASLARVGAVHVFFSLLMIVLYIVRGKFSLAGAIVRAFLWNFEFLDKNLKKRKIVQNYIRMRPDTAFIDLIMRYPSWKYFYYLTVGLEKYDA